MAKIVVSKNGQNIQTVQLEPGTIYYAGKDSSCDIRLASPSINDKHFKIQFDGESFSVSPSVHETVPLKEKVLY